MKIYEESIIKKKGNFTWIVTVISFLTVNLQYLWFWYSWFGRPSFNDSFIGTSPHLSALLAIDLIAIALHSQKKSTFNWKVIFILLFMFNLIFYVHMLSWITNPHLSPYFSLALLGAFPYFLILSVIDFIAVFINKYPHDNRAYTALLVVSIVLFFSGVFIFQFTAFGLIPRR